MVYGGSTHLKPARIEEELQQSEDRHKQIKIVVFVTLRRVQELATNEAGQEVTVHRDGHHLGEGSCQVRALWASGVVERPGLGQGVTVMGS